MADNKNTQEIVYKDPRDFEDAKDEAILVRVIDDITKSEKYQTPFFDRFTTLYQKYKHYKDTETAKQAEEYTKSNLFIPYIFNVIETAVPRIVLDMVRNEPFLAYKPLNAIADKDKAEKMTQLVGFQMKRRIKIVPVLVNVVKDSFIYGTAYTKQTWKYETRTKKRLRKQSDAYYNENPDIPVGTRKPTSVNKVTYDAPFVQQIPLEDLFFHPYALTIADSPYIIHRYWADISAIYQMMKAAPEEYRNIEKLQEVGSNGNNSSNTVDSRISSVSDNSRSHTGDIEVLEYWTNDWKVVVLNRTLVIQCIENPYWHHQKPFTKWTDTPLANEWYGQGMVDSLADLQDELNTTRNQRIDNVAMAINKMYKILRGAEIDPNQLVSRPNGFIEVDSMDDIEELVQNDVTSSAYKEEEIIKKDMDETSGVHTYDRGGQTDRRETATTATLLSEASGTRFSLKTRLFEEEAVSDMGQQIAELNIQFIDVNTFITITNDDGDDESVAISPDDIDADYDVVAAGSAVEPAVNTEVRQAQIVQLLNVVGSNPQYVDMGKFLKVVFQEFGFKEAADLINDKPPIPTGQVPTTGEGGTPPIEGQTPPEPQIPQEQVMMQNVQG